MDGNLSEDSDDDVVADPSAGPAAGEQAYFRAQRRRRRNGQNTLPRQAVPGESRPPPQSSSSSSSSSSSRRSGAIDLEQLMAEEADASVSIGPALEPQTPPVTPMRRGEGGGIVRFREAVGQREAPPRAERTTVPTHNVGAPWLAPPGDFHQIQGGQQGPPTQASAGTAQYPGAPEEAVRVQTPFGFLSTTTSASGSANSNTARAGSIAGAGLPAAEAATAALGDRVTVIHGLSDSLMEDQQPRQQRRTVNSTPAYTVLTGLGNPSGGARATDPGPSAAAFFNANPGAGPAATPTPSYATPPAGGAAPQPYDVGYRNQLNVTLSGPTPTPVSIVPGRPAPLPGANVGRLLSATVNGLRRATHHRLVSLVAGRGQRQGYTLIPSLADANAPHQRHRIHEDKANLLPYGQVSASENASRRAILELGEGLAWVVTPGIAVRPTF